MDVTRTVHFTLFAFLLCIQCGVSYRIYILPEPGAFCLGVFSGDDCITWSEYSARPKLVDHSTTLIFTPGVYSSRALSVANIKRFTVIGEGAQLQFQLSFSNIGEVRMHNLTLTGNNRAISVQNVQLFVMESCTVSQASSRGYSSYQSVVYISSSSLSRIINSTFVNKVAINVQSRSTLVVETSTFVNSSQAAAITGDDYSNVTIHSSRFFNNFASSYGIVYTKGPLEIVDCLFDGNSVSTSTSGAVVYSVADVTVRDSTFTRNNASYLSYYYRYRPNYYTRYYQGGSAIRGQGNINIYNCTFSLYTQTSSIIYAYGYNRYNSVWYYDNYQEGQYELYIANSTFYHSSRSIYSYNNVTIEDSSFYNITASSGGGGVVYSAKSVAVTNCTFINSTAVYGNGGVIYSQQRISIFDSVLINSLVQSGDGGAVYAVQDCTVVNSEFRKSVASNGNGGGIYSGNDVKVINCIMSECSAPNGTGGAIYSAARDYSAISEPNIVVSKSTFSYNAAECGGVLYTNGHYNHHMEFTDSTFNFNEASGRNAADTNATQSGGGVGCIGNTTLSIRNSMFNNNMAETVGGVLDLSFSQVAIEHSSFSQNSADDNGGVFHGQNYSTNFTIVHTTMERNSAGNGGVFYVRRSNSNIRIIDSKLIHNTASNQGGVLDIRGVTLTMDVGTVIANNTADSSGDVISACVSQITTYGLEARPDPVYPLYCSIYDEGNSFRPHPMSQTVSTDDSMAISTTEENLIGTTGHEGSVHGTESITTAVSEGGTTDGEIATSFAYDSTAQPTSATAYTSDSAGASHTHTPYEVTTSSPSDTTSQLHPSRNDATTTETDNQPPMIASTEMHFYTDEVTTTSVDATTPASVNQATSAASYAGHEGSTATLTPAEFNITTATTTTMYENSPAYSTVPTDSSVSTDPDRFAVLQVDQDDDVWKTSHHSLLQVSVISLVVLCMVCTAACAMMVTLFFVACKRRNGIRLVARGRYKKLSPTDKDLEETKLENEMEEYTFSEI